MLVLATTRPDPAVTPAADTLILQPLADEEVAELLEAALGAPLESRALRARPRHGEGNPFFLEELLSDLLDRGLLERTQRRLVASRRRARPRRPGHRPGRARRPHRHAPGRGEGGAASSSGDRPLVHPGRPRRARRLGAEVRTLVERGFVRPTEPELVFKHALTREVAYGACRRSSRRTCMPPTRAGWRARTRRTATPACSPTTTRRRSLPTSPSSPGATATTSFGSSRASALRWLRRAAELSLARFDLDDALSHLHRAAELAPDDVELWHTIGRVNALKFDGEAMWPAMQKAIELTQRPGGARRPLRGAHVRVDPARRDVEAPVRTLPRRELARPCARARRRRQSRAGHALVDQGDVGGRRRAGGAGGRAC